MDGFHFQLDEGSLHSSAKVAHGLPVGLAQELGEYQFCVPISVFANKYHYIFTNSTILASSEVVDQANLRHVKDMNDDFRVVYTTYFTFHPYILPNPTLIAWKK
jgi:hypothetical protein